MGLTEPHLAFQMVKSCLSNSFLSALFHTASRVVGSRSQALAGQRFLTHNEFPLWVSYGQGNKSSQDLDWTNYRSVLWWQSDNKREGGKWDREKAEIKSAMWASWKTLSHTLLYQIYISENLLLKPLKQVFQKLNISVSCPLHCLVFAGFHLTTTCKHWLTFIL